MIGHTADTCPVTGCYNLPCCTLHEFIRYVLKNLQKDLQNKCSPISEHLDTRNSPADILNNSQNIDYPTSTKK